MTSRLPHLVAILLCYLAVTNTAQFHRTMSDRITKQETLIQTRKNWNDQFAAIQPLETTWTKTIPAMSTLTAQSRVIQHINAAALGLALQESGLTVGEATGIQYNGAPIGLLRYPVSNQGGQLRFTATDYNTAWNALSALHARPDIRFTRARLTTDKGAPTLTLENFAILARAESATEANRPAGQQ